MELQIILNSNPWFSAVTDYSLQLARFVSAKKNTKVIYCAPAGSIALKKANQCALQTNAIPLFPFSFTRFFAAWHALGELVKNNGPSIIWVFEGREHTLCALHRVVNRDLWKETRLVRVRGQAEGVRRNPINQWVYTQGVSGVAFAAEVIRKRAQIALPAAQGKVQLYCTATLKEPILPLQTGSQQVAVSRHFSLDFSHPTITIVGRFDPVKGHKETVLAAARADFKSYLRAEQWVQFVFIGESQNIAAQDLVQDAVGATGGSLKQLSAHRWLIESTEKRIRVLVIDERLRDIELWMRQSSFGLIPSLDSEVICRVAVEFLQQGTPLISSDAGALSEVLSKSCALVFENRNTDELKATLEKSLVLFNQQEIHSAMRSNAAAHGARFGPSGWNSLMGWANSLQPFYSDDTSK
jgi:glycosyltransferase involved in cell wall biosynthesis